MAYVKLETEASKKHKKLYDDLKAIDEKYTIKSEKDLKSLGLEPMDYVKIPSKSYLEDMAKEELKEYKDEELLGIEKKYSDGLAKLEKQQDSKLYATEAKKNEIDGTIESKKKSTTNALIGKGLGRSSIIISNAKAFDEKKLAEYAQLDRELSNAITSLEKEKAILETQKQSALSSFDIAYASRINEKLTSINNELEKKQKEVLKYNNDIKKKEADYKQRQLEQIDRHNSNLLGYMQKNGATGAQDAKMREKLEIAKEYFKDMDKKTAIEYAGSSVDLERTLGSYYAALMVYLYNKKY